MARKIFAPFGGLTLSDHIHNQQTSRDPTHRIVTLPVLERYIVPLQHSDQLPGYAIVQPGDAVKRGQPLSTTKSYRSAVVHAPTSGVVQKIAPHPLAHPSGQRGLCVTIESDGRDEPHPCIPYTPLQNFAHHLQNMGIVGLGGAAFPTHAKIKATEVPIHTVVINGVECEPEISCDDMLMREHATEIITAAQTLCQMTHSSTCVLVIENNKHEAIAALTQATEQTSSVEVICVPTRYPSGSTEQVIYLITGQEIPYHQHARDLGFLCVNVATVLAIQQAVIGQPLTERIVTVTGDVKKPANYRVRIGTTVDDLLRVVQPHHSQASVIMGGPLMGIMLQDTNVPVHKGSNCFIVRTPVTKSPPPEMPCIRCGDCAQVCPVQLQPQELFWFSQAKQFDRAQQYHLFDCIECGCCAYVCPSNIPLVEYYRFAKSEIRLQQHEDKMAQLSKERFEKRNERLAVQEKERADRLAHKMSATSTQDHSTHKKQVIAEAIEQAKRKKAQLALRSTQKPTLPDND